MKPHVMIVDDDAILVMLMRKLLEKTGLYPPSVSFHHGKSAYDHLTTAYSPTETFIVFLDINMPVMNGWEFLDAIRGRVSTSNTFVYILSSSTDKADIDRAGVDPLVRRFLSKPVFAQTLVDIRSEINAS